jgi:hypothetical protein
LVTIHIRGPLAALCCTLAGLLVFGAVVASAQELEGTPCAPAEIRVSAYEQAGGTGQVTLDVSITTARSCLVRDIEAELLDAAGQPVPGVPRAHLELERSVDSTDAHLVGTVIWHNWCDDPALGPYGAFVSVNGQSLRVPRLALTPLCFAPGRDVVFDIEPTPSSGRRVKPGLISFGQRLAGFAARSDLESVAGLFEVREFTCPGDPAYPYAVCQGQPDGALVTGFSIGRWSSEGTVTSLEGFISYLSDALARFAPFDVRVFTVAETGFGDCPECAIIVLSTPQEATAADGTVEIMLFQVRPSGGQFRVVSTIDGFVTRADELALVNGGLYSGRMFVRIEPGGPQPPAVGTGTRSPESVPAGGLIGAGLLLLAISAMVLAGLRRAH